MSNHYLGRRALTRSADADMAPHPTPAAATPAAAAVLPAALPAATPSAASGQAGDGQAPAAPGAAQTPHLILALTLTLMLAIALALALALTACTSPASPSGGSGAGGNGGGPTGSLGPVGPTNGGSANGANNANNGNNADGGSQQPGQQGSSNAPATVIAEGEGLVINIADISDQASFYPVEVDGTRMEVIAVKAPDGSIRTAFNTCQICYDSGRGYYEQSGNKLVCQNCGNQFPMSSVEVEAGGCNPWPIFPEDKTVTGDSITISYDFLKKSKDIFANWKQ